MRIIAITLLLAGCAGVEHNPCKPLRGIVAGEHITSYTITCYTETK